MNLALLSPAANTDPRLRTNNSFYRPELDVLRFLAFFSVFLTHCHRPPIGSSDPYWEVFLKQACALFQESATFGMCIFFLLSAYLITELLQRERQETGTIHLKAFYVRRILRIWPLYFAALILGVLISCTGPQEWIGTWRLLSFLFLAGNWYTARDGYATNPIAPLWSISLEEQFYLLWPGVAKFSSRRTLLIFCCCTIIFGLGTIFYLRDKGVPSQPALWTNSFVQFSMFAVGAILALLLKGRAPRISIVLRSFTFFCGILLWLIADGYFQIVWGNPTPSMTCIGATVAALGCVAIFLSLLGIPSKTLPRPLIYLGKISYGLYVFSAFTAFFLNWALGSLLLPPILLIILNFVTTVGVATLSYEYFEKPFLKQKRRFEFILSRKA